MKNFHAGWYLIYTKPRHEKKVHTRLRELNIDAFLPLKKKLRTWHDRKKYIDQPLFPSYVFIYLNDFQSYYVGLDMEGVLYYVRSGKEVARVQESVINNIKLAVNHEKDIEISDRPFQPGRKLVLAEGPLAGLSCEVIQLETKKKLLVRVELLQRSILMSFPEESLMAV